MKFKFQYPVATLLIIAICVIWALIPGIDFSFSSPAKILAEGGNFAPYTLGEEPWRIVTSLFVHGGFIHLLLNMLALFTLGKAVEPVIGHLKFVILFLICGIFGNLLSLYWNLFAVSAGASGAIFGLFGFDLILTVSSMRNVRAEILRTVLTAVIYVSLILLIGIIFPFDNAAHLGGLLCGTMLGILHTFFPGLRRTAVFIGVVLFTIVAYYLMPRYQVVHYRQFHGFLETDEMNNQLSASFKSDAEAEEGFLRIRKTYDSLASLFSDSLENAPVSVITDRKTLRAMAEKHRDISEYKIRLLQEKSYRYLDSIELVQSREVAELIHPLALDDGHQPELPPPSGKIVKIWYDEDWRETVNIRKAKYYRIGYKDSLDNWNGRVEDYFIDGGIQMKGYYRSGIRDGVFRYYTEDSTYSACGKYDSEIRTGIWEFFHGNGRLSEVSRFADRSYLLTAWDEDGNLRVENGNGEMIEKYSNQIIKTYIPYTDGLADGTAYGNYGDGRLKYQEVFEKGELIMGRSYSDNSTNTYDKSTFYPFPVGGMENFNNYVKLKTSSSRLSKGSVRLIFTCPPSGEIYDIRIWESHSPDHDSTAIAILKDGPAWNPAREHGLDPITSEGVVTITFN